MKLKTSRAQLRGRKVKIHDVECVIDAQGCADVPKDLAIKLLSEPHWKLVEVQVPKAAKKQDTGKKDSPKQVKEETKSPKSNAETKPAKKKKLLKKLLGDKEK